MNIVQIAKTVSGTVLWKQYRWKMGKTTRFATHIWKSYYRSTGLITVVGNARSTFPVKMEFLEDIPGFGKNQPCETNRNQALACPS